MLGTGNALAMMVTTTSGSTTIGADGPTEGVASAVALGSMPYVLHPDGRLAAVDTATRQETVLGNVLYTGGYADAAALTAAQTGDKAALAPVELLFVSDGRLMGLCPLNGALYTLLDETGAFAPAPAAVTPDTAALLGEDGARLTVLDICAQDGALYLLTRNDLKSPMLTALMSIDLGTGAVKAFTVQNLRDIEPYQGGKLLARSFDMSAMSTATSAADLPASEYGVFDPAADTFTTLAPFATDSMLGGYAVSGMAYSALNDTLYYLNGSRIEGVTVSSGEKRTSAYSSEGMFGAIRGTTIVCYAEGGFYLRADGNGWQLFQLDTDAVKSGALRIFGEFGSDAHKSFTKNYPDIPVEVADSFTTSLEALASAMVSESDAYDVLNLIMSYMPVERLIQKGYATDLSIYPEIMERVQTLDPRFVAGMTVDGKLYGVPVASTAYSYGVNMEQWEALGLTEEDLPQNLVDFYGFLANYMDDYGDDNPDLRLFNMGGDQLKQIVFSLMLHDYITYCQAVQGGDMTFDSDIPRQLLTAFEQIDFKPLAQNTDATAADFQQKPYLFTPYMTLTSLRAPEGDDTPLVMALIPGGTPVLGANLSVLVMNPKTKRADQAVKYIANYLDNLDDATAIALHPDDNEPRVAKDYDKNVKAMEDELAKQQALLTAAAEDKKAAIQDGITQLTAQLDEYKAHRFSVTAEQIAYYREHISGLLAVCQQSVLYSAEDDAQNELNKVVMQYLDGASTQDQFLKEMDKRARMMALENQ